MRVGISGWRARFLGRHGWARTSALRFIRPLLFQLSYARPSCPAIKPGHPRGTASKCVDVCVNGGWTQKAPKGSRPGAIPTMTDWYINEPAHVNRENAKTARFIFAACPTGNHGAGERSPKARFQASCSRALSSLSVSSSPERETKPRIGSCPSRNSRPRVLPRMSSCTPTG